MKKLAILASVSAMALGAVEARADYILDILHTNDLHSRIESINKYDSTCSADDEKENKCFGGIARVRTMVSDRRFAFGKEKANLLVLDAGDQFQGSLFYSTYKGKAAAEFMNQIGYDAMAIGNHEFDDGAENLGEFIAKVAFPLISGNTIAEKGSVLDGKYKDYVVFERGGEKIAVVSVLAADTKETSSPGDSISFTDPIEYLNGIVPKIEAEGINKIIALTHVGIEEDKRIAANVKGIDVIVGGHSHTLLSNTDEKAYGPYPLMVDNPDGVKVPIVTAYAYSKYLGELSVVFDDAGKVIAADGVPHLLDSSVKPDAGMAARVAALGAPIEELKTKQVGMTSAPIDGDRNSCRLQECSMGDLVTDAMLDRVEGQGVQIAITNGGGLRASIDQGDVTMGEVLTVLPFQNTLSTFELSGKDIVGSLENGVSETADVARRFAQVAGLRYAWDESVEPGQGRVKQVQVMENGEWKDINPDKMYKVVSNNFMRAGGDGYKLFKENGQNAYDYGPGLETVVADYLSKNNPYTPKTEGRIVKGTSFDMAQAETSKKEPMAEMPKEEPKAEMPAATPAAEAPKAEAPAAEMTKTEEKPAMAETGDYVIQAGDNLWDLARKFYGDATEWKKIEEANGVENVRRLKIGDTIKIPK